MLYKKYVCLTFFVEYKGCSIQKKKIKYKGIDRPKYTNNIAYI